MSSHDMKNTTGGVSMGHVIETPGALVRLWRGPASRGVVEAEGEKPSATRLWQFSHCEVFSPDTFFTPSYQSKWSL